MTAYSLKLIPVAFILFIFSACQKNAVIKIEASNENLRGKPGPGTPPVTNGICDYEINESSILAAGWSKTFEDNFTGDLSLWNKWYGGAYNNEMQLYQATNASVSNGNLVIEVKKENVTGPANPYDNISTNFSYTSARLESISNFSANNSTPQVRMMARIKLPSGYGMWPAFWSYGDPWPTQGEIDILEARGQEDKKYQTNYFYGKTANRNLVRNAVGEVTTNTSLQTCYHVYEVIWSQNQLNFYWDGNLVKTNDGGYVPNMFGKSERITLNVAVGGLFFSNLDPALIVPGKMFVDWVKVFTNSTSN